MATNPAYKQRHTYSDGIDAIDRRLIQATQSGLPLHPRPYQVLAEDLNLSEQDVIQRLRRFQDTGLIRRIGAVPNHYRLGYGANGMSVWDVPDERVTELGKQVGALAFVSHCYHRPRHLPQWPYNLFAMVHAKSREQALADVQRIAQLLGDYDRGHAVLFSTEILKKTGMRLKDK